jgi:hypothetical protein
MAAWRFLITSTLCAARAACSPSRPNGPGWTPLSLPARPGGSRTCRATSDTSTPVGRPAGDPELTAEAWHLLGLDARKVRYSDGLPDVSGPADELGLD